jgi:hypothetical protein
VGRIACNDKRLHADDSRSCECARCQCAERSISAAFSPTMTVGAWVLPCGIRGKIDASAIRSPMTPWTRSSGSTTPIRLGPDPRGTRRMVGVLHVAADLVSSCWRVRTPLPGCNSSPIRSRSGRAAATSRARSIAQYSRCQWSADTPAESHTRRAPTSHIGGIRPRPHREARRCTLPVGRIAAAIWDMLACRR